LKLSDKLLLVLIPALLYAKSLFYDFSPMDEQWMIVQDTAFLSDWKNILTVFKEPTAEIFYRPLFMITLIINYHLGELSPFAYHFTNLLLHLVSVVLLFKFLKQLGANETAAFFSSLLFAVHPILLHAVVWIPGGNDVMLGVCTLGSCIQLLNYLDKKQATNLLLHLLFFGMALMVKETAVVLPVVFLMLYLVRTNVYRSLASLLLLWMPMAIGWILIHHKMVTVRVGDENPLPDSITNLLLGFMIYFGKIFLPIKQSLLPTLKNELLWPGLLALGITIFMFIKATNKKMALTGILIFIVLLFIPTWYAATKAQGEYYEHRLYTPLIGMMVFASQLKVNWDSKTTKFVCVGIGLLFGSKTFFTMNVYKDQESFLEAGIKDCPEYYMFHFKKGNILLAKNDNQGAIECFNKAITLNSSKPEIYNNRANAFVALDKRKEAIQDYTAAFQKSNEPRVLLQRCRAYNRFGEIENAMNDLSVLKQCCQSIIPPEFEKVLVRKWRFLMIEELSTKINADPTNGILYVNRAKYYFDNKMGKEALADLAEACKLEPNNQDFKRYYNELSAILPK
jgi:protein O-mannosyl-transferase